MGTSSRTPRILFICCQQQLLEKAFKRKTPQIYAGLRLIFFSRLLFKKGYMGLNTIFIRIG